MARPHAGRFPEVHGQRRFQDDQSAELATVEDVAKAYQLAYDLGCLGITVFRDGCKSAHGGQVLHVGTGSAAKEKAELEEHEGLAHVPTTVKAAPADVAGA